MAYITGDLILHDHYNTFATGTPAGTANHAVHNINTVWGTGTGSKGYGQSTILSPVATGTNVTATQWSTLIARQTAIATHQGTGITAITQPVAGNTVSVFAALQANIDGITLNSTAKIANGTDVPSAQSKTTGWTVTSTATHTVTFASADAARYFFNAGGELRINLARSGGSATTKNANWSTLLSDSGTVVIAANGTTKAGGAGAPNVVSTTTGYYQVTTSDAVVFRQYAVGAPYTVNNLTVSMRTNGPQGANADNGTTITITVLFDDAEVDTFNDTVDGTLTSTLTIRPPSTAQLTDTWGTPTVSGSMI